METVVTKKLPLSELAPGDQGVITSIDQIDSEMQRLQEMGMSEGASLRVVRYAPLGDPIEIKIRGFYLSIGKNVARHVSVMKQQ